MNNKKTTNFDNLKVAKRIGDCRKMCGYTQQELADLLGMKRTNIANYEAGRIVPPGNVVVYMSEIFVISTDYLLGQSDSLNLINDEDFNVLQKAKAKLSDDDWVRAMDILKLVFVEAFDN